MKSQQDYSEFVEHPRYGRGPRFTDLATKSKPTGYRLASYISQDMIPGTAVEADLERQTSSPVPVLYYFDLQRLCVDCCRPFIFFAEEQKHWYENLGFVLDADCVRCVPCRKRQQGLGRMRERYEELYHVHDRSAEQDIEMAECCLSLIEASLFHRRQVERVRMLLNRIHSGIHEEMKEQYNALLARLAALHSIGSGERYNAPGSNSSQPEGLRAQDAS